MSPNPFSSLLHSRKFWLFVLTAVVDLVTLIVGEIAGLDQEFVLKLLGIFSGVASVVIVGIFVEDAAEKGNSQPSG
jgi:hypothetical protein